MLLTYDTESTSDKREKGRHCPSPNSEPCVLQRTHLREREGKPQNERKYLHALYLIRDLNPKHTKNSPSSTIKRLSNFKMGKGFKETSLQRKYTNGQLTHKKMLNIISK